MSRAKANAATGSDLHAVPCAELDAGLSACRSNPFRPPPIMQRLSEIDERIHFAAEPDGQD